MPDLANADFSGMRYGGDDGNIAFCAQTATPQQTSIKSVECCFSLKTKYDSEGNILEYRARGRP